MRTLLPIEIGPHFLDQPLPHDLYNHQGVLLVTAGSVINDPERLAQLAGLRLFRAGQHDEQLLSTPLRTLNQIALHYAEQVSELPGIHPDEIAHLANALRQLVVGHPEVCVGMAQRLPLTSLAQRHALYVAAVAVLVARALGRDEDTELAVANAALSMNLASQALQDHLSGVSGRPDTQQRETLRLHPLESTALLARAGVSDDAWLSAVIQHHENMDGSGYPLGLEGDRISAEARILRAADVWCALLSQRHCRMARYPEQAVRLAFDRERGRLDDAALLALRRLMGRYPPGTLVRLANRETALITRWFNGRAQPAYAVSLLRPSGSPMALPLIRDTRRAHHTIRDYTYLPMIHQPIDWDRAWAMG